MTKIDESTWFEAIKNKRGVYDGLSDVSYSDLIHQELLKRIDRTLVEVRFPHGALLGNPHINIPITHSEVYMDLSETNEYSYPYIASSGEGVVVIDWVAQTIEFKPDHESYGYSSIEDMVADESMRLPSTAGWSYGIDFIMPQAKRPRAVVSNSIVKTYVMIICKDIETDRPLHEGFDDNPSRASFYIDKYVLDVLRDGDEVSELMPMTMQWIYDRTGVTPSTLSGLKTGKKDLQNLTFATVSILWRLSMIRFFDIGMLQRIRGQDDNIIVDQLEYRVIIERYGFDDNIELIFDNESLATKQYDDIASVMLDTTGRVILSNVVLEDGATIKRLLVRASDISGIALK